MGLIAGGGFLDQEFSDAGQCWQAANIVELRKDNLSAAKKSRLGRFEVWVGRGGWVGWRVSLALEKRACL